MIWDNFTIFSSFRVTSIWPKMWSNWAFHSFPITLKFKLSGFPNDFWLSFELLAFSVELGCQIGFEQRERLIDQKWIWLFLLWWRVSVTSGAEWLKLLLPIDRLTTHSSATTSVSAWKARMRGLNHTEKSLNTDTPPIRDTQGTRPKRRVLQCIESTMKQTANEL